MKAKLTQRGFVVYDGDEPRLDMRCENSCIHYREGEDCKPSETPDDLCYSFCGRVCGHWEGGIA